MNKNGTNVIKMSEMSTLKRTWFDEMHFLVENIHIRAKTNSVAR